MAKTSEFRLSRTFANRALARGHYPEGADWQCWWRDGT